MNFRLFISFMLLMCLMSNFRLQAQNIDRKPYEKILKEYSDKNIKAKAHYNIGNSFAQEKNWEKAVESYKKSLLNNPTDADAKYNLAYAQKMLKKQDQNKDKKDENKDKDNKDKKDDKDKKDQDDKKDPNKPEDKKDKDKEKEQQQNQAQPNKQINEQQADQLLNAIQQSEQEIQKRKGKAGKASPVKLDKDW